MHRIALALWQDESGFVVSAELALVGTIASLGMVAGLAEASNNVHHELHDVGAAVGSLDQSFTYTRTSGQVVSYQDADHR